MSAASAAPARAAERGLLTRRRREQVWTGVVLVVVALGGLLFLAPLIWMLSTSLKDPTRIYLFPPEIIPNPIRWDNYPKTLAKMPLQLYAWNTTIITGLALVGEVLSTSLCAFGFARVRFPGRDALFLILLGTIMLPGQVTLVPTFLIFKQLGWLDSYLPLTVPFWLGGRAFSVFLLRQFIATVPLEMDDAAKIDGCSLFRIYWNIVLPLVKPALGAVAIFSFLHHWNDFFHPVIYLNTQTKFTLALALNQLRRADGSYSGAIYNMEQLMVASLLTMIPPLLVFAFAQRYFIQGIVFSGVKG